jgi:hypothetical protein
MKSPLGVILRAEPNDRLESAARLERSIGRPVELRVAPEARNPAAARNAALGALRSEYATFLDENDLQTTFLGLAGRLLDRAPSLDFVTSWGGGAPLREEPVGRPVSLAALLARPWLVHIPTVLRVSAWRRAGGYDEGLDGAEEVDLLLRLVQTGGLGEAVPDGLLRCRPWDRGPTWAHPHAYGIAARLFEKHRQLFAAEWEAALHGKEWIIRDLFALRRETDGRFRAVVEEAQSVERELERVRAALARSE